MTVKRTSQVVAEAVSNVNCKARASQVVAEAISNIVPKARASQVIAEMVSTNVPDDAVGGPQMMVVGM